MIYIFVKLLIKQKKKELDGHVVLKMDLVVKVAIPLETEDVIITLVGLARKVILQTIQEILQGNVVDLVMMIGSDIAKTLDIAKNKHQ